MSVPNTSELDDAQIEALIKKLSAIKGSAPELIAALETEANSRLSKQQSGRSGSGGGGRSGNRGQQQQQRRQANATGSRRRAQPQPAYEEEEEEDEEEEEEDDDDDDDEETDSDDDEFDEDGPCVGEGYSDEVSVISEMTTPTVVSAMSVAEEERYQELNRKLGKSNKPDLLGQVNRVNAAKQKAKTLAHPVSASGGLNPARRQTYTSGLAAMAKISETSEAPAVTRPKTATSRPTAPASSSKKASRKPSSDGAAPRKTNRGLRRDQSPAAQREKAGSGIKKKSSSGKTSGTTKKTSSRQRQGASSAQGINAFSDEWQKSLTAGDFTNGADTDDTGFPFSFGDDANNAFGGSGTNFFKDSSKKSNSTGHSRGSNNSNSNLSHNKSEDAFDPFGSADPFATARNAFESPSGNGRTTKAAPKARPTNSRPRRTSVSKVTTKR